MNTYNCKGPCPRAGGLENSKQGLLKQRAGYILQGFYVRAAKHCPQGPQGAAMTVLGPLLFEPFAPVIHEVAKAFGPKIESVQDEGKIADPKIHCLWLFGLLEQ